MLGGLYVDPRAWLNPRKRRRFPALPSPKAFVWKATAHVILDKPHRIKEAILKK